MKIYVFLFVLLLTTPSLAWNATVDGPDVFGNVKVFAFEGTAKEAFVVQCNSKDELFVAFVMSSTKPITDVEIPASLFISTIKGTVNKYSGILRSWNSEKIAVVLSGRTREILGLIGAIGKASGRIQLGIEIFGNQSSASFSSQGSTKAMNRVIKFCQLDEVENGT